MHEESVPISSGKRTPSDPLGAATLISLLEIAGPAGSIFVLEPFPISQVRRLYINHLPNTGARGSGHAHKSLHQVLFAAGGRIRVTVRTPLSSCDYDLEPMADALRLTAGAWREYVAIDGPSTLLVVASESYTEDDYIRDWHEYCDWFENLER